MKVRYFIIRDDKPFSAQYALNPYLEALMISHWFRGWTGRSALLGFFLFGFGAGCWPDILDLPQSSTGGFSEDSCAELPEKPESIEPTPVPCGQLIALDSTMVCAPVVDAMGKTVWQGERLMPGVTGDLARYCRYSWVDSDPMNKPDPKLVQLPTTDDCTFVTPQSWPASFDAWAHNEFVQSIEGERAPSQGANGLHSRVVVLDTFPDIESVTNDSHEVGSHGETLAHLIHDLACGTNAVDCAVEVTTQLVMPWRVQAGEATFHADGGNVGRLSDVVVGMWKEIEKFRQELQSASDDLIVDPTNTARALAMPTRIVFNESFAFGGEQCNNEPAAESEDVVALYKTMQAAACLGMAHVAAAGNHTGGETPSGELLCPAHWDQNVKPSIAECENLFGLTEYTTIRTHFATVTQAKFKTQNPHLLIEPKFDTDALTSVGAVDFSGLPIVMTRSLARPETVALGIGGIGWNGSPPLPTALESSYLFGTSVSAAVVSARMAALWSLDEAHQRDCAPAIKESLANTAQRLTYPSGGACQHLAADVYQNIPWIGKKTGSAFQPDELQNPLLTEGIQHDLETRNDSIEDLPAYAIGTYRNNTGPVCLAQIPQCVTENSTAATGTRSTNSTAIWPQPTDPVCVRCGIIFRGNGLVELWLDPNQRFSLAPSSNRTVITGAALVIGNASGKIEFTIPINPANVITSSVLRIEIPVTSLRGRRAWISAYDDQGHSFSQQIFVIP